MKHPLDSRREIVGNHPFSIDQLPVVIGATPRVTPQACFRGPEIIELDPEINQVFAPILPSVRPGVWTRFRMGKKNKEGVLVTDHPGELPYIASLALGFDDSFMEFADYLISAQLDFSPLQMEIGISAAMRNAKLNGESPIPLDGTNSLFFVNNGRKSSFKPSVSLLVMYWKSGRKSSGVAVDHYPLDAVIGFSSLPGDTLHLRNKPLTILDGLES